jgi:hypothetical protein
MYDLSLHGGQRGRRQKYFKCSVRSCLPQWYSRRWLNLWWHYFEMMYQELTKLPEYKTPLSSCDNSELIVSKVCLFHIPIRQFRTLSDLRLRYLGELFLGATKGVTFPGFSGRTRR